MIIMITYPNLLHGLVISIVFLALIINEFEKNCFVLELVLFVILVSSAIKVIGDLYLQRRFQIMALKPIDYYTVVIIALTDQKRNKQGNEPIRIPRNYLQLAQSAGKIRGTRCDSGFGFASHSVFNLEICQSRSYVPH